MASDRPAPSGYLTPLWPFSSGPRPRASWISRAVALGAACKGTAPLVSVFAKVDEAPLTLNGSGWVGSLAPKSPPPRIESAARESEAMGPGASVRTSVGSEAL